MKIKIFTRNRPKPRAQIIELWTSDIFFVVMHQEIPHSNISKNIHN